MKGVTLPARRDAGAAGRQTGGRISGKPYHVESATLSGEVERPHPGRPGNVDTPGAGYLARYLEKSRGAPPENRDRQSQTIRTAKADRGSHGRPPGPYRERDKRSKAGRRKTSPRLCDVTETRTRLFHQ